MVEPAGMNGGMQLNSVGIPSLETIDRRLPPVRRSVVRYPKDAASRPIGFLAHDQANQIVETIDSRFSFAETKDSGSPYVPCRHLSQGSHSFVFVLDTTIMPLCRRSHRAFPATRLNAGFFISGYHKIIAAKRFAFPDFLIQIPNSRCLLFKIRILGPNPASITPRPDSIFAQPTPNRFSADGSDNSMLFSLLSDFAVCNPGKGKAKLARQLTRKGFDGNNNLRGKKRWACLGFS